MLEKEDIDQLKEIFVTRKECDATTEKTNEDIHRIDTRLSIIENNSNKSQWLLKAILTAIIGLVVASVWNVVTTGVA